MSKKRVGWLILTGLIFGAIPVARTLVFDLDHQIANLITAALVFFGCLSLWLWALTLPKLNLILRSIIFLLPAAAVFLFFSQFEFRGFSGEMVPQIRRKGVVAKIEPTKPSDPGKVVPVEEVQDTKVLFSQFLGPNRTGLIEGIKLSSDWQNNPPEIVWIQAIGAGWSGFAISGNRAVTLEQIGDDESVSCYEVTSGKELWKHKYSGRHANIMGGLGPRSTPTIVGGVVYTQGATGNISALELETGKVKWEQSILKILEIDQVASEADVMWGRSGSPLVTDQLVIVPLGGRSASPTASLIAFDRETGKIAWQGGDDQISYASPIVATIAGTEQIVSVNEKTVGGYNLRSGDLLWSFPWPGLSNQNASVSQPIVLDNNQVLVSKGYGGGAALYKIEKKGREWSTSEIWAETSMMKTKFTSAVLKDGYVFGLSDGILECMDPGSGERKWKDRRGRYGHGQLLVVGDHCLVLSEEGELCLVDAKPDGFEERGRLQVLNGTTWNVPSIVGSLVLVRNGEQMAAVRLKLAE